MSDKPTGVFVRLPLSYEQRNKIIYRTGGYESTLLAIGTPVTHEELCPVGYTNEDAIGGLATGIYQSASIFRDEDKEHHDTVALVCLDVAQAKLAERDAEIARLREYYEASEAINHVGLFGATLEMYDRENLARKALKGPEA